jgi:hypothetical protein
MIMPNAIDLAHVRVLMVKIPLIFVGAVFILASRMTFYGDGLLASGFLSSIITISKPVLEEKEIVLCYLEK